MKKITIILFFVFAGIYFLQAQNIDTVQYRHGLGFATGRTTGIGLAYLYQPHDFGVQFVVGTYDDNFNIGVSPMLILGRDEMINLFIYSGNSAFYGNLFGNWNGGQKDWLFSNGFGVGFEAHQKQFSFNLMGGIASYYWLNDDWSYGFTIDASIYYRLK